MAEQSEVKVHPAIVELEEVFKKWSKDHSIHAVCLIMDDSDKTTLQKSSYIWLNGGTVELAVLISYLFAQNPKLETEVIKMRIDDALKKAHAALPDGKNTSMN